MRIDQSPDAVCGLTARATGTARKRVLALVGGVVLGMCPLSGGGAQITSQEWQPDARTVLLWHLNEGGGTTAADAATPDLDGTNNGTIYPNDTWTAEGRFGSGLHSVSNGTGYVSASLGSGLFTTQATMDAWIRPTGMAVYPQASYVMGWGGGGSSFIRLYEGNSVGVGFKVSYTNQYWAEGYFNLPVNLLDGTWRHIAGTYSNGVVRLYLNGALIGSADTGYGSNWSLVQPTGFVAGGGPSWAPGDPSGRFIGDIDEVRLSTVARTDFGPASTPPPPSAEFRSDANTVLLWHLNEGAGGYAADAATPVLDGANLGAVMSNNGWTPGKFGGGLHSVSNGTGYVSASLGDGLFSKEATMEAWVRPTGIDPDASYVMGWNGGGITGGISLLRLYAGNWAGVAFRVTGDLWAQADFVLPVNLLDGNWRHIATTYSNGVIRLYLNGTLIGTSDTGYGSGYTLVQPVAFAAAGGYSWDPASTRGRFIGDIDEVRLSNAARTNFSTVAVAPMASISPSGSDLVITYAGVLQSAWTVAGPYTDVVGATSPYIVRPIGERRYFRSRDPSLEISPAGFTAMGSYVPQTAELWKGVNAVIQSNALTQYIPDEMRALEPTAITISQQDKDRGYVVFARHYMDWVCSFSLPDERTNALSLTASLGEYEPTSFAVYALENLDLKVTATDLQGGVGTISKTNLDIRVVSPLPAVYGNGYWMEPRLLEKRESATASAPGTVLLWHLNEGTNNLTYDASSMQGGANTGTITGNNAWTPGQFHSGLKSLANGNGYVSAPLGANLFSTQATLDAWIKPTAVDPVGSYVMGWSGGGFSYLRLQSATTVWVGFTVTGIGGDSWAQSGFNLPVNLLDGTWRHIAGTYSNGVIRCYLNGTLVGSANTGYAGYTLIQPNSFVAGGGPSWEPSGSGGGRYIGDIDEVRLSNRAQSDFSPAAQSPPAEFSPERTTVQFWVTVHVPEQALPGVYQGKLLVQPTGREASEIAVTLNVLPFNLVEPDVLYGMCFFLPGSDWNPFGQAWDMHPENFGKYFADMREHGMSSMWTWPSLHVRETNGQVSLSFSLQQDPGHTPFSLDEYVTGYREAGFTNYWICDSMDPVRDQIASWLGYPWFTPNYDRVYTNCVAQILAHAGQENWPPFCLKLVDEPGGKTDDIWMRFATNYYGLLHRSFPQVKTFVNVGPWNNDDVRLAPYVDILGYNLSSQQAVDNCRNWGKDYWLVNQGSWGRYAKLDRLAWGWYVRKNGARAMFHWVYTWWWTLELPQPGTYLHPSFMYAVPAPDGPIPTIGWEGVREGIDDMRYIQTLAALIARAEATGQPALVQMAADSEAVINAILADVPIDFPGRETYVQNTASAVFDAHRQAISSEILKLKAALP